MTDAGQEDLFATADLWDGVTVGHQAHEVFTTILRLRDLHPPPETPAERVPPSNPEPEMPPQSAGAGAAVSPRRRGRGMQRSKAAVRTLG